MKSPFDDAVCPTPSPGGNHQGLSGGYSLEQAGDKGLINSPYTEGICPPVGGKETSSSELGTTPTLTNVKDAPAGQPSGMSSVELIEKHVDQNATFNTPK